MLIVITLFVILLSSGMLRSLYYCNVLLMNFFRYYLEIITSLMQISSEILQPGNNSNFSLSKTKPNIRACQTYSETAEITHKIFHWIARKCFCPSRHGVKANSLTTFVSIQILLGKHPITRKTPRTCTASIFFARASCLIVRRHQQLVLD
jgi:hypothetical protein